MLAHNVHILNFHLAIHFALNVLVNEWGHSVSLHSPSFIKSFLFYQAEL